MSDLILAIDPGPVESAYVMLRDGWINRHDKVSNRAMLGLLNNIDGRRQPSAIVIEKPVPFYSHIKMQPLLDTVHWCGRFEQHLAWLDLHSRIVWATRKEVASHVCRAMRGKLNDSSVRQAMIDRWGPRTVRLTDEEQDGIPKSKRRKSRPGPTAGITKDQWAALAVATWWIETRGER